MRYIYIGIVVEWTAFVHADIHVCIQQAANGSGISHSVHVRRISLDYNLYFFMTFKASSAACSVTIQSITHGCYMTCSDTLQIAAIRSKCSESATFERECHLKEIEMKAEKDYYYSASCMRFTVTSASLLTENVHHEFFYSLKCEVLIISNDSAFVSCKRTTFTVKGTSRS